MDVGNVINTEYRQIQRYNTLLLSFKNPLLESKIPDFSAPFKLGTTENDELYVEYTQQQREKIKKILEENISLSKSKEKSEKIKEEVDKVIKSIEGKETTKDEEQKIVYDNKETNTRPSPANENIGGAS